MNNEIRKNPFFYIKLKRFSRKFYFIIIYYPLNFIFIFKKKFVNNVSNYIKLILKFCEIVYIRLKFLLFLQKIVIIITNIFFRLLLILFLFRDN